MVKSTERRLPVWKVGSSIPDQVKVMTYKIVTCHYLPCAGMNRMGQGLVSIISGQCDCGISGHGACGLVSQWGSTIKATMNAHCHMLNTRGGTLVHPSYAPSNIHTGFVPPHVQHRLIYLSGPFQTVPCIHPLTRTRTHN